MPNEAPKPAPFLRRFTDTYFSPELGLRVRLFHILAMGGVISSLLAATSSFAIGDHPIEYGTYMIFFVVSLLLLVYSAKTGRYRSCYMITIVLVFLLGFPLFFFQGGGYVGAMTYFFVFAILFTIFMLEGKQALTISALELFLYIAICVYDWLYIPVNPEVIETGVIFVETVFGFSTVSVVLGICLYFHLRLYNAQQKKLDEQNAMLMHLNRMKTEFLTNASHEMRTPLTVTSVNVQTVMEILEDMGDTVTDPEAERLLKNAQSEIMRLSRMVGGMLTLASMCEDTDRRKLNFSSLLQNGADMLRLSLEKNRNTVKTNIESCLSAFGNADLLAQVLSNLLQNAGAYTENGTITVSAERHGNEILVTVTDTGTGIVPELLPHVFERGVSTGGTGFGLYLCKTVIESHGGGIRIESEPGNGTAVCYTLPFYEGQIGGEDA